MRNIRQAIIFMKMRCGKKTGHSFCVKWPCFFTIVCKPLGIETCRHPLAFAIFEELEAIMQTIGTICPKFNSCGRIKPTPNEVDAAHHLQISHQTPQHVLQALRALPAAVTGLMPMRPRGNLYGVWQNKRHLFCRYFSRSANHAHLSAQGFPVHHKRCFLGSHKLCAFSALVICVKYEPLLRPFLYDHGAHRRHAILINRAMPLRQDRLISDDFLPLQTSFRIKKKGYLRNIS